jgi:1,2-phenylacetyl-CoA epoxidase catalytic subunit
VPTAPPSKPDSAEGSRYRDTVLQLLSSHAYRERGAARLFAGGVALVPPASRWRDLVAHQAREEEEHYARVAAVWTEVAGRPASELDARVDARLIERPLPAPDSFPALGMATFLFDRAGRWQIAAYAESTFAPYRDLARAIVADERGHEQAGAEMVRELCAPGGAAVDGARAALAVWLPESLRSFGRPGTPGDRYAVDAGLKNRPAAAIIADYFADVTPTLRALGLDA